MNAELCPLPPDEAERTRAASAPAGRRAARPSRLRVIAPLAILAVGVLGSLLLLALRPSPDRAAPEVLPPLVRAAVVAPTDVRLSVTTQGTVEPRTETQLVAEVSGRVDWVSPKLVAGGFFDAGEALARLDVRDYEVAMERAEARLAQTRSQARLAEQRLERREQLFDSGVASDATLDEAESAAAVARAAQRDAAAALAQARLSLERTTIAAPYDGRVRDRSVDVGQFLTRGAPIATVYAVDYAEVRLPIPDEDLTPLGLGVDFEAGDERAAGAPVALSAGLGGRRFSWPARVVRTEGELDPRTRMVTIVARVDDPYARDGAGHEAPLPVGLFVEARIEGREVEGAVVLPRSALRGEDRVLVVDADDRLRFRDVEILRRDREQVVIGGGLEAGERVCLSPLEAVTDGMRVRVATAARARPSE